LVGFLSAAFGFLYGAMNVVIKLLFPQIVPPGLATVLAIVSFFAGVQLLALGIIGEYIRKIYLQSLGRPLGFIQDRVGFAEDDARRS
jgi:dolichol-phosphate mannosyltransferase